MENSIIKVLFVEDNKFDQMAFERLVKLDDLPYDYKIAKSITEARSQLKAAKFDIVITDFCLGDGTGFDIFNVLEDTPVIFVTGAGDEEIAIKAIKEGAYHYLIKDLERAYLKILPITISMALEHRKAQEGFKLLSQAVANSIDGVNIMDISGVLIYANAASASHYGYEVEELLGLHVENLYRDKAASGEIIATVLQDGKWDGEQVQIRKDGSSFPAYLTVSLIKNENDKTQGIVAVVRDITEREKIEKELSENNDFLNQLLHDTKELAVEAEAANIAKSEFLANMSHEIRTPMNGVMGMTGLLLDTELDEEQRDYAETIERSAEALLIIINDILDFSKIEAGKLSIEPIPFNLKSAIDEVTTLLAEKAIEKNVELKVYYASDTPTRVIGDPGRIKQIIINLAGNAIKFTNKGQVSINVGQVDLTENDVKLEISIEDTGIGIPKNKLQYIFDKFSQADTSTTRKFGGTGLGLAISKQLVELMNGKISVSSEPGKGSTFAFEVSLPLDKQSIIVPTPVTELKDIKFLIVQDNETDRKIIQEQFKNWGFSFGCYPSGEEALAAMRKAVSAGQPYQIAILNYLLPQMDGETLALTIKADPDLEETVLVMLTSAAKKGDAKRFQKAGFTAFLTKPIRPSILMDTLATVWAAQVPGHATELITSHFVTEARLAKNPNRKAKTLRVLLAEDNIVNQKVAVKMLQKLNCRVDVAANGREAVEMVQTFPYDLLFMDCQMPEMNGFEATAAIRKWEEEKRYSGSGNRYSETENRKSKSELSRTNNESKIPIIAMTANAMQGDREECLAAGMDDYIAKPIKKEKLEEALVHWATNREITVVDEIVKTI